jgi:hypothetical protein
MAFRQVLYKARAKIRAEKARAQGRRLMRGPVPVFDASGRPLGICDVFDRLPRRVATPYDDLRFRVFEGNVIIVRVTDRVLQEPEGPPHPEAYDLAPDEVSRLPPWPLLQGRPQAA